MYFPKRFNREMAIKLGRLIEIAYSQYNACQDSVEWELPSQFNLIKEIKYSGALISLIDPRIIECLKWIPISKGKKKQEIPIGYVARQSNKVFIVFRGTQTSIEWIKNLNTKFIPFSINGVGNVHDGFFNAYMNIRKELIDAITSIKNGIKIYVSGHSLGAAFASFAAYDIELTTDRKISALYTFGSPRIGDNEFVTAFNGHLKEKSFRIINSSDMVTGIPFPTPFAGFFGGYFSHVETPVVFTVQTNDQETNHHMTTYISELMSAKDGILKSFIRNFV